MCILKLWPICLMMLNFLMNLSLYSLINVMLIKEECMRYSHNLSSMTLKVSIISSIFSCWLQKSLLKATKWITASSRLLLIFLFSGSLPLKNNFLGLFLFFFLENEKIISIIFWKFILTIFPSFHKFWKNEDKNIYQ